MGNESSRALVSIIIPVYNTAPYLRECLDSIVHQTYADIEIICINDGSDDGSPAILYEYRDTDARISVIDTENRGQSAARNDGIRLAKGKYLYFMDSDDTVSPELVERCVRKMENDRLDQLFFDGDIFSGNAKDLKSSKQPKHYYRRKHSYPSVCKGCELFTGMINNREYRSSPCMQMVRIDLLSKNGFSFIEGIIHEDEIYTFKCIVSAERVSHIPETLFHRRARSSSIMMSSKGMDNFIGYGICIDEIKHFAYGRTFDRKTAKAIEKYKRKILKPMMTIYTNALSDEERARIFSGDKLDPTNQYWELMNYCKVLNQRLRKAKPVRDTNNDTKLVALAKRISGLQTRRKEK